ncbi:MAG: dTDP-4-amino-4,6-dideoxygalactose transaminase, partial [Rhodothermales bacterium]
ANRRQITTWYRERLADVPVTIPFADQPVSDTSAHVFVVVTRSGEERDRLNQRLRDQDVQTSRHYPPSHLFSIYRSEAAASGSLSRTESFARRVLTLPLHPKMTVSEVDRVCDLVRKELQGDRPSIRRTRTEPGTGQTRREEA